MENIALVSVKIPYSGHESGTKPGSQRKSMAPTSTKLPNTAVNKGSAPEPTIAVKFLGAGLAACFGDLVTFPLDTAKVRLQVGQ